MDTTADLTSTASGTDPRVGLKAASALRHLAETLEAAQVANAWQDIAEVLDVTKQAVHQKHSAAEKSAAAKRRGARSVRAVH